MGEQTDTTEELQKLQRQWESITDVPASPRSTMNVIEYGLGKQQRAEVYVNRLLCYLLDPEQPHQLGTDFLEAFLGGLPTTCGFEEDTFDLSDVRVNEQVSVWGEPREARGTDSSPGYLDLLLDVPNEWFLLVELKFSAAETGTEFYCSASQFDDRLVSDYESGQYYLYMHQENRPEASGECFANLTWREFIDEVLNPFIAENTPRYPQRTVTQLHDLRDDIQEVVGMNEQSSTDQEKVALYLEHVDAITDVTSTFEAEWDNYCSRWGQEMMASFQHNRVTPHQGRGEEYTEVTIGRNATNDERWILYDSDGDWQHVFKYGWRRRENEDDLLIGRAEDRNDLRIGFYHRMGADSNRDTAVRDHILRFNFRCMGSNPTEFKDIYTAHFDKRVSEIEECLTGTDMELTGQKQTMIKGAYPIRANEHGEFFSAYTAALNNAFNDLVVENPDLVRILSEVFEASIKEYR